MSHRARRIEVRIDRLVLRGVDPRDRAAFTAAVARGLAERLAREAPPARAGRRATVEAGPVAVRRTADGQTVGAAVAKAVHGAIGR